MQCREDGAGGMYCTALGAEHRVRTVRGGCTLWVGGMHAMGSLDVLHREMHAHHGRMHVAGLRDAYYGGCVQCVEDVHNGARGTQGQGMHTTGGWMQCRQVACHRVVGTYLTPWGCPLSVCGCRRATVPAGAGAAADAGGSQGAAG